MTFWTLIVGCALMTAVVKGIGPWALGGRELPGWFPPLVTAMVPALLSALVVTAALTNSRSIEVGADTAGVAAALVVAWRGGSMLTVVLVAVAVTAGLRMVL